MGFIQLNPSLLDLLGFAALHVIHDSPILERELAQPIFRNMVRNGHSTQKGTVNQLIPFWTAPYGKFQIHNLTMIM